MAKKPLNNFKELFAFYYESVKPLYSEVQTANEMPAEMLFELNAAFDHLSRHWQYDESEQDAVRQAYSHLKRSCLDAFRLKVKETRDQYDELRNVDISIIDNGEFQRKMIALWNEISRGAKKARSAEGDNRGEADGSIPAFDLWVPVYDKCVTFEQEFYTNPHIEWARTRQQKRKWWDRWDRFVIGFLTGLVTLWVTKGLWPWLTGMFTTKP